MQTEKKNKIVSIKVKLLSIILPVVIFVMVVLVGISYFISKDVIRRNAENLLSSSIENQSNEIEAWLDENLSAFQMAKTIIEATNPDKDELQTMLNGYYGVNDNCMEGLYVADVKGNMITAKGAERNESNPCDSVWFKQGMTRWNMGFTDAYTNADGVSVISATGILKDDSNVMKVISADMTLERVSIIVNSFVEMDEAQAFLVDSVTGEIMAHRDSSLFSQKLSTMNDSFMQQVGQKIEERDYDMGEIGDNITGFSEIAGTNWILVSYIPKDVIYADIDALEAALIIICLISVVVIAILIERAVSVVIKPVKELTHIITSMTNGDFTIEVKTKKNDEIGVMSKHVEKFIAAMRSMIASIHSVSEQLSGQANTSDVLSSQMHDASRVQSHSMKELNKTVEQLSLSVTEIAENATTLAMVVADTRDDGEKVDVKMRETVDASQKGKTDIQHISGAMTEINDSVQKLKLAIDKVGQASGEITNITSVIGEIADQTNLLSLNASIEAARAGEAGRGFAVVASEIGQLAKMSTDSVHNIEELINEINTLVDDTVKQTVESVDSIDRSSGFVENALETFDIIFDNINEVDELVKSMIEKVQKVDDVAGNVAAISQEQAASSQEILATSENMVQQAENITKDSQGVSDGARELLKSSEVLYEQVAAFKIEKGEDNS